MEMSLDLFRKPKQHEPRSFSGWALQKAATLDINGSRGLIADIATASALTRQAAFAVLATVDLENPNAFLACLEVQQGGLGEAIRSRLAKDLVAAAFGVDAVPRGYLRALIRIGSKPLEEPHLYRRLFEIFTHEADRQKSHALRYCGPIDAAKIQIVDVLDPVLIHPEIVKHTRNIGKAREINKIIDLVRSVCSKATNEALIASLKEAAERDDDFSDFVQRWIEKADQFPAPPFLPQADLVPLTTAAAMIETGRDMQNCLGQKIGEVVLGLAYFYRLEAPLLEGQKVSLVAELQPLSNGTWQVSEVYGKNNRIPAPGIKGAVAKRFVQLGAVVAGNPAVHPHCQELSSHLNVFRYGSFETFALGNDPDDFQMLVDQLAMEFEAAA
jgi:hypothetical protein